MVAHGYEVRWNQQIHNCAGRGRPHFGTEAGRDFALEVAGDLERGAAELEKRIATGEFEVRDFRGDAIPNPQPHQIESQKQRLRHEVSGRRAVAADLRRRVAAWKPAEPRDVVVEKSSGPALHFHSKRWGGGKLCASSAMGAMRGATTTIEGNVTCDKCRAIMARGAK